MVLPVFFVLLPPFQITVLMQKQNLLETAKRLFLAPARLTIDLLARWDIEVNKIAGAFLLAGTLAMMAAVLSGMLYGGEEHGHGEAKRGYTIAGAEAFAPGGSATAAAPAAEEKPVDIMPFLAKADAAAGAALIKRCTACHTFDKGGKHGVGPNNYGVVGGPVAHASDYAYSEALKAKHGERWNFQALSDFLANPKKAMPGNKMAFAGIKNPEERANLIAHLNSLSDAPVALPKP